MRWFVVLSTFILCHYTAYSQYSLSSAESRSGLLVGIQKGQGFFDVNYNRENSKFGFSFSNSNQFFNRYQLNRNSTGSSYVMNSGATMGKTFPNFISYSTDISLSTSDGKATLFKEDEFRTDFSIVQTVAWVFDQTSTTAKNQVTSQTTVWTCPGGKNKYSSKSECEQKEPCVSCSSSPRAKLVFERLHDLNMHTVFLRGGIDYKRRNFMISSLVSDTTFSLSESGVTTGRLVAGYNYLMQIGKWVYFTAAFSLQGEIIPNSFNHLDKRKLQQVKGSVVDEDGNEYQEIGDTKTYYQGDTKFEGIIYPRSDLLFRFRLPGKEEKSPYLGLLYSVSPSHSWLEDIGTKLNMSLGITVHPPNLPDQVVFAIMADWSDLENNDPDHKPFSINFHAGVPFKFK